MKNKTAVFLSLILAFSFSAFAQTKTVTNADLEKYRQKRLQAEREYRENYARLGFPSPEELERKRIEDEKKLVEFSQQLEARRLEREAMQAEAENQALWTQNLYLQSQLNNSADQYTDGYLPYYYGGYYYNRSNRYRRNNRLYYDSSNFQKYNPTFFNLQFPPPRPPQRIFAPGTNKFPVRNSSQNPRIRTRTGRGRN
jgi:hypothetical protein